MLQKMDEFMYATALDLNMGYNTIKLNPDAQELYTIVLPWEKYRYRRLPMGVAGSPDIFQAYMSSLMVGLEFVRIYLDDSVVIIKIDFQDHIAKLDMCLKRINDAGLRINAEKAYFRQGAIESLGYWVKREGVQPIPEKGDAMLKMEEPKTKKNEWPL